MKSKILAVVPESNFKLMLISKEKLKIILLFFFKHQFNINKLYTDRNMLGHEDLAISNFMATGVTTLYNQLYDPPPNDIFLLYKLANILESEFNELMGKLFLVNNYHWQADTDKEMILDELNKIIDKGIDKIRNIIYTKFPCGYKGECNQNG
jgi:hypothetical protein